ncbi:MAG: thiamine pyrophosphate-dependent enzyme, partial [Candidatus Brocadiia bacterium]|nr:thiamine pyrophosphate-dependent enzyme [Candidatus Brocadiia bacterium]
CFFGDGASHGGGFHEALNLAGVWHLPVIFICENNLYALSVPFKRSTLITDIADRAASYGFPGVIVDGNDVIAVHDTVREAVGRARKGEGPTLIEAKTYRWRGHFVGDPCPYRSDEEVERWKKKDPVARFRARLAEKGLMSEEEAKQVDDRTRQTIDDAEKFALEAPDPDPESVMDDVYV